MTAAGLDRHDNRLPSIIFGKSRLHASMADAADPERHPSLVASGPSERDNAVLDRYLEGSSLELHTHTLPGTAVQDGGVAGLVKLPDSLPVSGTPSVAMGGA